MGFENILLGLKIFFSGIVFNFIIYIIIKTGFFDMLINNGDTYSLPGYIKGIAYLFIMVISILVTIVLPSVFIYQGVKEGETQ